MDRPRPSGGGGSPTSSPPSLATSTTVHELSPIAGQHPRESYKVIEVNNSCCTRKFPALNPNPFRCVTKINETEGAPPTLQANLASRSAYPALGQTGARAAAPAETPAAAPPSASEASSQRTTGPPSCSRGAGCLPPHRAAKQTTVG